MNNRDKFILSAVLEKQEKILQSIVAADERMIIFDIGACEGESSIRYARLFPNAAIYTFEPLPSNFELVLQNIKKYDAKHMHPFQYCLADKSGVTTFYVSSGKPEHAGEEDWDYGNKSSSLLPPAKTKEVHSWLTFEQSIRVETTTLEQFCKEHEIPAIDFIHMDVQGAELMVLQGAGDFIQHINMVWLEVEAVELYKGQPLKHDVEQFMRRHGFVKIEDTVYTTAGDQFWVRKEYISEKKGKAFIFFRQIGYGLNFLYKRFRRKILNYIEVLVNFKSLLFTFIVN